MQDALILLAALQQQAMVAEMVAVIGGEDHDRVDAFAGRIERCQHAADGVVDTGDHAAGQRLGFLRFAG